MSALLKAFLLVAALAYCASALLVANVPLPGSPAITYPLASYNTEELCNSIGRVTGCSGCAQGTEGLCSWVKYSTANGASFKCIPSLMAKEEEVNDRSTTVNYLCPVDPAKEPMVRDELAHSTVPTTTNIVNSIAVAGAGTIPGYFKPVAQFVATSVSTTPISRQTASTIFSKTFVTSLFTAANGSATITVDRTSLWGDMGFAKMSGYGAVATNQLDCASLAQEDLFNVNLLTGDAARLYSDKVRFCLEHHVNAYYNSRCTPYGVAKSGICQSAFTQFIMNCGGISQSAYKAVSDANGPTLTLLHSFMMDIVTDDTPFCVKDEFLTASHHALHLAGLDKPLVANPCVKRDGSFAC